MKAKDNKHRIKCPNCNSSPTFQRFNCDEFQIYFCKKCLNGFTYPVPKNIGQYYNDSYWIPKGFLGILKKTMYHLFQLRRKYWIMDFLKKGRILDVGAGEAIFSKFLNKNFEATSLDLPSAKIQNPDVIKTDFLTWKPKIKFDAVVFWESLEHTVSPHEYIKKAASILNDGGYLFVEYPRADCLESHIFKRFWYHLDPPRHLSHLTPKGLEKILTRSKFRSISHSGVPAFEYTITGFIASTLNLFPSRPIDFFKDSNNSIFLILLFPLIIISTFVEICFFIVGQSPIYLTVAKK
ncbi:MAG: class I SAM-dependent methyltransferase [Candidatus Daviesbacteria bacterium]|nr:class I SAM-dependent methyltransferase [Candidatus Daviesbacteria bacterium]